LLSEHLLLRFNEKIVAKKSGTAEDHDGKQESEKPFHKTLRPPHCDEASSARQ
jgi:hypothetical protein